MSVFCHRFLNLMRKPIVASPRLHFEDAQFPARHAFLLAGKVPQQALITKLVVAGRMSAGS